MRTSSLFSAVLLCSLTQGCTLQQADRSSAAGASGASTAGTGGSGQTAGSAGSSAEAGVGGSEAGSAGAPAGAGGEGGSAGAPSGAGGVAGQAGGAGATAGSGDAGSGGNAGSLSGGSAGSGAEGGMSGSSGQGGAPAGGQAGAAGAAGGQAGGPGAGISSCTEAVYFSGDPANGEELTGQNPAGHPLKGTPPLFFHDLAFNGDTLGVATQTELWTLDMQATEPVYVRVTGKYDEFGYKEGPCDEAHPFLIDGLAPLPGGDWLLTDFVGNSILRVSSPGKSGCKVEVIAGNAEPFSGVKTTPFNPGDADGPGLEAKLQGPKNVATDEEGKAYFFDSGNNKIKRVGNDQAHTVTTLADLDQPGLDTLVINALTAFGGSVYGVGYRTVGGDIVLRISDAGELTFLVDSSTAFDGYVASNAGLNAVINDGESLYALGNVGRIWKVSLDGTVGSYLAGGGKDGSLSASNYDFSKPFPAKETPMYSQNPYSDTMGLWHHALYVPSVAGSAGHFLYKFSCQ